MKRWAAVGLALAVVVLALGAAWAPTPGAAQDGAPATIQALQTMVAAQKTALALAYVQVAQQRVTVAALRTQVARLSTTAAGPAAPSAPPAATAPPAAGQVTAFGQTAALNGCLESSNGFGNGQSGCGTWTVSVEANPEVRTFMEDQSILPQRGQFLVIWFTFMTDSHLGFPVASFRLKAGPAGHLTSTYDVAHVATAALLSFETQYNPALLDNGTPYRIGVVFDIKPADTHFELIYDTGGQPYPVDIVFNA